MNDVTLKTLLTKDPAKVPVSQPRRSKTALRKGSANTVKSVAKTREITVIIKVFAIPQKLNAIDVNVKF
jgi:hypothetical protein